jgi:hypothetical protein
MWFECTFEDSRQNKRIVTMKPHAKKNRLRLVLILVVMFLISLETAFAQDDAENVTVSAQNTTRENHDMRMPHRIAEKPGMEKTDEDLLVELIQPESANKGDQTVKAEACSSVKCTADTTERIQ